MYTAYPLPHPYLGYFLPLIPMTCFLICVIFMTTVLLAYSNPEERWYGIALDLFKPFGTIVYGLWFFFAAIGFVQGWDEPNPKNEKVILKLARETPYVVLYESPVGLLKVAKSPGKTYPQQAIFYKN
jgi:hypothetical protein